MEWIALCGFILLFGKPSGTAKGMSGVGVTNKISHGINKVCHGLVVVKVPFSPLDLEARVRCLTSSPQRKSRESISTIWNPSRDPDWGDVQVLQDNLTNSVDADKGTLPFPPHCSEKAGRKNYQQFLHLLYSRLFCLLARCLWRVVPEQPARVRCWFEDQSHFIFLRTVYKRGWCR